MEAFFGHEPFSPGAPAKEMDKMYHHLVCKLVRNFGGSYENGWKAPTLFEEEVKEPLEFTKFHSLPIWK